MVALLRRRGLATFGLLIVVAEMAGRSLTGRVDGRLHVEPLANSHAAYYPVLLVGVKVAAALGLAALLARATRALAAAGAAERLLAALGHRNGRVTPRLRPRVSFRIWFASFAATSTVYLLQTDVEGIAAGRWPLLAPWLHTYALPIFALLSVLVALVWRLARWVHDIEDHAERALEHVRSILTRVFRDRPARFRRPDDDTAPRRRFGLAFESRPPPVAA
jgi:hypothetical protein